MKPGGLEMSTEIETLRLNPSPARTRRFRHDSTRRRQKARNRRQCARGAMRAFRKRQACAEGLCEPFSSACPWAGIARVPILRSSLLSLRLICLWLSFYSFSGIRERRESTVLLKLRHHRRRRSLAETTEIAYLIIILTIKAMY